MIKFSFLFLIKSIYIEKFMELISNPVISVVIPVYNGREYLVESLDSVFNQTFTEFEVVLVDDGSSDNYDDLIKKYTYDSRFRYIKKDHNGISEALNLGIQLSRGEFIARFDADDVMYPNRLERQLNIMREKPDVDILSGGFRWGVTKVDDEFFRNPVSYYTKESFKNGNVMAHPTVMMRKASLSKLPYLYEKYYDGGEDLKLWLTACRYGLKIYNDPEPVIKYREQKEKGENASVTGTTSVWHDWIATPILRSHFEWKNENPELTCIIGFQNEGAEIEKTVISIRATAGNVNIMLINDCSTDGFNYRKVAEEFGCEYYETTENLGCAGSRDFGVSKCKSKYFVLLDGHMRFYHENWEEIYLKHLHEKEGSIIYANTLVFTKENFKYTENGGEEIELKVYQAHNEDGRNGMKGDYIGAMINFDEPGWEFTGKWADKLPKAEEGNDENLITTSGCMGATYATSVAHWEKIGGLFGLIKWGSDEPFMALKTWLAGGKCYLIKDFPIGHFYRWGGMQPYVVTQDHVHHNQLLVIEWFGGSEENKQRLRDNLKKRIGENLYNSAMNLYNSRKDKYYYKEQIEEFYKNVATVDLSVCQDYCVKYQLNEKKDSK